jgi:hypothetical protein
VNLTPNDVLLPSKKKHGHCAKCIYSDSLEQEGEHFALCAHAAAAPIRHAGVECKSKHASELGAATRISLHVSLLSNSSQMVIENELLISWFTVSRRVQLHGADETIAPKSSNIYHGLRPKTSMHFISH